MNTEVDIFQSGGAVATAHRPNDGFTEISQAVVSPQNVYL